MSVEHVQETTAISSALAPDLRESTSTPLGGLAQRRGTNQLQRNLKRFLIGNRLNLAGVIIVLTFIFLSIFGQTVSPHDPYKQDITNSKLLAPAASRIDSRERPSW